MNKYLLQIALVISLGIFYQDIFAQSRGISIESKQRAAINPYTKGVYRALVIGNNEYHDPKKRWPELKTAVSGAESIARILRSKYGFQDVILLKNASRKTILRNLEVLSKKVNRNDSVLLYYAGHGYLDPETRRGYWVPSDAKGMDTSTFLRNSTIRDELSLIADRVQHTLLLSDSCFSGTLLRGQTRSIKQKVGDEAFYRKVAKRKSVQILAAGGVEFVDDNYKKSGHSPFTYFLLNELSINDQPIISAGELSTNIKKLVANNVKQVPEAGILQGAGDELGEFIFLNIKINISGQAQQDVDVQMGIEKRKVAKKLPKKATKAAPQEKQTPVLLLPVF